MNHHFYLLISSDWLKVRPRRQHQHQSSLQCACVFHNVLWWLIGCMHIAYCTLGLVCKPICLYILYVLKTTKLTKIQPNFCPPAQDNIYQHNQIKSNQTWQHQAISAYRTGKTKNGKWPKFSLRWIKPLLLFLQNIVFYLFIYISFIIFYCFLYIFIFYLFFRTMLVFTITFDQFNASLQRWCHFIDHWTIIRRNG